MGDHLFIRHAPIARKYALSFLEKTNSFELVLSKADFLQLDSFMNQYEKYQKDVATTIRNFQLKEWNGGTAKTYGYNKCFKKVIRKDKVVLTARVTVESASAIALTLHFLFDKFMYGFPFEHRAPLKNEPEQEALILTRCTNQHEAYGHAMSAELSSSFTAWLCQQDDDVRNRVNKGVDRAIRKLFRILCELPPDKESGTGGLRDTGFLLYPPSGIYTCQFGISGQDQEDWKAYTEAMGYKTFCHNLDHCHQQLMLLAGFAKICEAYRESQQTT